MKAWLAITRDLEPRDADCGPVSCSPKELWPGGAETGKSRADGGTGEKATFVSQEKQQREGVWPGGEQVETGGAHEASCSAVGWLERAFLTPAVSGSVMAALATPCGCRFPLLSIDSAAGIKRRFTSFLAIWE